MWRLFDEKLCKHWQAKRSINTSNGVFSCDHNTNVRIVQLSPGEVILRVSYRFNQLSLIRSEDKTGQNKIIWQIDEISAKKVLSIACNSENIDCKNILKEEQVLFHVVGLQRPYHCLWGKHQSLNLFDIFWIISYKPDKIRYPKVPHCQSWF